MGDDNLPRPGQQRSRVNSLLGILGLPGHSHSHSTGHIDKSGIVDEETSKILPEKRVCSESYISEYMLTSGQSVDQSNISTSSNTSQFKDVSTATSVVTWLAYNPVQSPRTSRPAGMNRIRDTKTEVSHSIQIPIPEVKNEQSGAKTPDVFRGVNLFSPASDW